MASTRCHFRHPVLGINLWVTLLLQEDATLVYGTNEVDEFKLQIKHFDAFPGEVVAVVGRVGCGKSSLFNAILGNMVVQTGAVKVGGKIAYVPQTPWVQNLTLRDNILFGLPYDEDRYKRVVHACALELDFTILPKGASRAPAC
jgi:ATP-binding cassette, subfamily C (CFTR/MRP), member 1